MTNEQLEMLERLAKLKQQGLLSDEEFMQQKQAVLNVAPLDTGNIHTSENLVSSEENMQNAENHTPPKNKPKFNRPIIFVLSILLILILSVWYSLERSTVNPMVNLARLNRAQESKTISELAKEAESKFNAYKSQIAISNDSRVNYGGYFIGDITSDGLDDIVISFFLSPKDGGNVTYGHSLVFYENLGTSVKVIGGFEAKYLFKGGEIRNNKIYITKTEYADEDAHCCPSIMTPVEISVKNGKAIEYFFPKYIEKQQ